MQTVQGILPATMVDVVVPFRDQIIDRTAGSHASQRFAGVAERNSTIHTTGTLVPQFFVCQMIVKFVPVQNAQFGFTVCTQFSGKFHEAGWLAHNSISL